MLKCAQNGAGKLIKYNEVTFQKCFVDTLKEKKIDVKTGIGKIATKSTISNANVEKNSLKITVRFENN